MSRPVILVAIVAMLLFLPVAMASPNANMVVVRAHFQDRAMVRELAREIEPWEVHDDEGYLVVGVDARGLDLLARLGFGIEIDARRTARLRKAGAWAAGQRSGIPGFPCYRTVEETFAAAQAIAAANPGLATWTDVGNTWEKNQGTGGYDMMVLTLTNKAVTSAKPALFVMGSIHAREYTPAELLTRFAESLVAGYGTDPDITWLLDNQEIHLLLQANPDGRKHAESGQYWRKNTDNNYCANTTTRGADLNRNFAYNWGCCGGSSGSGCSETYRGPSAASEPETQAIEGYLRANFPDWWDPAVDPKVPDNAWGVFIDFHSYGSLILWPWGYTGQAAPNGAALTTLGRKMGYLNSYYPEQATGLYPTDGTTDDFAYGDLGLAAFTIELGNDFFQDCATFQNVILPANLDVLLYAAKAARRPYLAPNGPEALAPKATPAAVIKGNPVTITATIDDTRFSSQNGTEPTQTISGADLFADTPPWQAAGGQAMTAVDGAFDSKTEGVTASLDTSTLTIGRHLVFLQGSDASGSKGVPSAVFVDVLDPGAAPRITGIVRDQTTLLPLAATVSAGSFMTTSDPATGAYDLLVVAGTYTMTASAPGYATATVPGVTALPSQVAVQDFDLLPTCPVFTDDVENGDLGYSGSFAITTESSKSPTHSWTDSPGGNYGNNINVSLTMPAMDFTGMTGVSLAFDHTYDLETGYDYGYVEYSTDGGASFTVKATYNGFGHTTWSHEMLDLAALDGVAGALIRFRIKTDAAVTGDGWHLDNLTLIAASSSCGGTPPALDYVAGRGFGSTVPNQVALLDAAGQATGISFYAYGAGRYGAGVATGDLNGPPYDEILTGPGPGNVYGPQIKGFLRDGTTISNLNFYAYGTLRYGVNPGSARLDTDAYDEILTGAGQGDVFGPHVRAFDFDGAKVSSIPGISFFSYKTLKYGVMAAGGDLDGAGLDEMATAPGPGPQFAATIRAFSYSSGSVASVPGVNFNAFATPQYGATVASGDANGDGAAEMAAAPGPGPALPARFKGFRYTGSGVAALPGFDVTPPGYPAAMGGRVALFDIDRDGSAELLTGAGPAASATASIFTYDYDGTGLTKSSVVADPFPAGYGVNPSGGMMGY